MTRPRRHLATLTGLTIIAVLGSWWCGTHWLEKAAPPAPAAEKVTIYDPDPQHLWNRLHRALLVRTGPDGKEYGHDRLDPLLWRETRILLEENSHEQALAILDEFLTKNVEKLIEDPLKRAILQRDLWAVFDWTTEPGALYESQRRALQRRLARIIRQLALPSKRSGNLSDTYPGQIRILPDNYAAAVESQAFAEKYDPDHPERPFLPANLFQKDGPWVELRRDNGSIEVAPTHVHAFGARSAFRVFLRLPEGRNATLAYLAKLRDFPQPEVPDPSQLPSRGPNRNLVLNPELPQFPVGTQVALVRQMLLMDQQGKPAITLITEKVQLRVYRVIPKATLKDIRRPGNMPPRSPEQDFYEITLRRALLFAGKSGGLRPLGPNEKDFLTQLSVHGYDEFESARDGRVENRMPRSLETCIGCHRGPGVHSFLTYAGGFFPREHLPELDEDRSSERRGSSQGRLSAQRKREQYSWGELQGLWATQPPR